jgi:hypothetical protein
LRHPSRGLGGGRDVEGGLGVRTLKDVVADGASVQG